MQAWRGGKWDSTKQYFQRRIEGRSAAAVFVAADGRATLLGVTEQLVGAAWTGAAPFHYAGSLGPLPLADAQCAALVDLGDRVAGLGLRGLFGVDVLLAPDAVYAVDVNPRFPASVEVLERGHSFSAVGLHVEACREGRCAAKPQAGDPLFCGKAILFALRRSVIGPEFTRLSQAAMQGQWPDVADVPAEGSVIEAGRPMMTLFAQAQTWEELELRLCAAVEKWRAALR